MIVVTVANLVKHYGPEAVLDGATFDVHSEQRVGLVGPNGTGKTTLLRILARQVDADSGVCDFHPSVRTGYLEQQPVFEPGRTLWDEAKSALDFFVALQHEAETTAHALALTTDEIEHRRLAARFDFLQQELHRHDAYQLDHKVERVLDGLRFPPATFRQPVASLSGGEQNRLILAKLLLAEPDLMLLDEPSNHLDIEATEWLESFLTESPAAMVVVSHDRYFLDKVTNRTLELFRGTIDAYTGNFTAYRTQKAERLLVERRTYEKQQIEIAKTEEFIRRNFYGQKHAQAEDRRKKLARIERVDPPREIAAPPMRFAEAERSGDIVLRVEHLSKAFDRPLFSDVTFDIIRGQRWALLGPNGSGKTTLLKCLLGVEPADEGSIALGQGVWVGYFDQHLASLSEELPVVDAVRPPKKDFVEQQRRDLLALFGLTGDTVFRNVGQLSGGERCRAALARLSATDANFLVLDEPTNHLDLWARDALENALLAFNGTVLFVSHDRYFVDRVADHLLVVGPERVRAFEGNYQTYQHMLKVAVEPEPISKTAKPAKGVKPGKTSAQTADTKSAANPPKRRFPFRKVTELENDIVEKEEQLKQMQELLANPDTYRDGSRIRDLKLQIAEHEAALRDLYAHWEEAVELNW